MAGASVWYFVRNGVKVLEMAKKNCSLGKISESRWAASMMSNEAVLGFGTFFVLTASIYFISDDHIFNKRYKNVQTTFVICA